MQLSDYHIRGRDTAQPCVAAIREALGSGSAVYLVGKGPSLDELTADDFAEFPNAPILCINESVQAIEKLPLADKRIFCVQYDQLNGRSNKPKRGRWLLSDYAWKIQQGKKAGAIKYKLKEVAPDKPNLTAATALSIAALTGATKAVMLAFDAAFSGNCDYADSIGYKSVLPGQNPRRFVRFAESGIPRRAAEEGMQLIWQAPKDFWLVALVLRSGGSYGSEHVKAICQQLKKNLQSPFGVVLLTDCPVADVWKTIPLVSNYPGWFAKLELFRDDLPFRGGLLFTDLDNYFGHNFSLPRWDTLESGKLYMPNDPFREMFISALMAWRAGSITAPFTEFIKRPITRHPQIKIFSDQEIINATMQGKIKELDFISSASWKKDKPETQAADCILFHGKPKPWDVNLVKLPAKNTALTKRSFPAQSKTDPALKAAKFLSENPQFIKQRKAQ